MPQLIAASVKQLLGRFDHEISFPVDWPFLIIHGPNGVGKTKLLEMIAAVCRGRLHELLSIPFDQADFVFDDQSHIAVGRVGQLALPGLALDDDADPPRLDVVLTTPDGEPIECIVERSVRGGPRAARLIERELGLQRTGDDEWFDPRYGDQITSQTIADRYREMVPGGMWDERALPDEPRTFTQQVPVHLIETQRLLIAGALNPRDPRGRGMASTVTSYAEDLVNRLNRALAENTTTAQALDRTFPRRVMNAPDPQVTDGQIRERYAEQGRLRDRLGGISLLDAATGDLPLPDRDLLAWERLFLWTYLDDTDRKLETFQPLLERAQLLQEIVNARFLFKSMAIDRERGFRFATTEGAALGPQALSSGEQHELVLGYDLLFNVAKGSLVLIDEPEISLHVSWQQQFLNDLLKVSELQGLRFIIATHSPQIVHKWWRYAKALYEEQDEAHETG